MFAAQTNQQATHPMALKPLEATDTDTVDTRFGRVRLNRESPIVFPRGLLGLPNRMHYCISDLPNEKFSGFKLLQSLEDYALSFITLPLDLKNDILEMEDLITACDDLGIPVKDAALLLIMSVHRQANGGVTLSVNARAPLIVDTQKKIAAQYVFTSDKYKVQHLLNAK